MGRALYIMVVKTELCNYSGFRIYPGHGKKFIRADQKMFTFINGKTAACQLMKRRNLTTKWTVQYRRKKAKAVVRTREIVGLSAEMLEKKRAARPVAKDKQRDAVLKEMKTRKGAGKKATKK